MKYKSTKIIVLVILFFIFSQSNIAYAAIYWSAGGETGDLSTSGSTGASEWQLRSGGGEYNSGTADSAISTDYAHTGTHSIKATISTPSDPTSGTRLFRWEETQKYQSAYYSAGFYFPTQYTLIHNPNTAQLWNLFQYKSLSIDRRNEPL